MPINPSLGPAPIPATSWTHASEVRKHLSSLIHHAAHTSDPNICGQLHSDAIVVRDWLELLPSFDLEAHNRDEDEAKTQEYLLRMLKLLERRSEIQTQLKNADSLWIGAGKRVQLSWCDDKKHIAALLDRCEVMRKSIELIAAMVRKRLGMEPWGEAGENERTLNRSTVMQAHYKRIGKGNVGGLGED